jgi:pyruvate dehydrogenase E1 component beta subunit
MIRAQLKIDYADALNEAIRQEMEKDDKIILMGENVSRSSRRVTRGLFEQFGRTRVRDTPISETAFIGAGIGAAIAGLRPIVEIMLVDFSLVAMDQILNQMAKTHYVSGGLVRVPLILRTVYGGGTSSGATHSETLHALFTHMPGLKIVVPSNPYDAKGLLISSIRDDNPVVFMEHRLLYSLEGYVPKDPYSIPFGMANLVREGEDITVVAFGRMVMEGIKAAETLKGDLSVEVIDPRTLVPLDEEAILRSVKKTGKLVVVDEDYRRCGFSAEIASIAAEKGFHHLSSPITRVSNPNIPLPYNSQLEEHLIPDKEDIVRAIQATYKS